MLYRLDSLVKYTILATDGEFGKLDDGLFDDLQWIVRYFIIETGNWFQSRKVIISSEIFKEPDATAIPVGLTKEQVKNSPASESEKPVSEQERQKLQKYFRWSGSMYPTSPLMVFTARDLEEEPEPSSPAEQADPHLRSIREVTGYHIHATDGEIGHVTDFLIEAPIWTIRYLIVDTRNWLPSKHVLIAIDWIQDIDWANSNVSVELSKDMIEKSPEFDPDTPVDRPYEQRLHTHYTRPAYWE